VQIILFAVKISAAGDYFTNFSPKSELPVLLPSVVLIGLCREPLANLEELRSYHGRKFFHSKR
jgi:hypothetical protein